MFLVLRLRPEVRAIVLPTLSLVLCNCFFLQEIKFKLGTTYPVIELNIQDSTHLMLLLLNCLLLEIAGPLML